MLDGAALMAADTYADARRLALDLHAEGHADARLALRVTLALIAIASEAHRAAEIAASVATGEAGATW